MKESRGIPKKLEDWKPYAIFVLVCAVTITVLGLIGGILLDTWNTNEDFTGKVWASYAALVVIPSIVFGVISIITLAMIADEEERRKKRY